MAGRVSFATTIAADAKAAIDEAGEDVTYTPSGGSVVTIKAIPHSGPLGTRGTDGGRTLSVPLVIAVSKTDVPAVKEQADTCQVPGAWVNKTAATTLRVAKVMQDRADPGVWLLGLS